MREIFKQALAEEDLINIWLYSFDTWGAAQADHYLDVLHESLCRLAENPQIGTDCSHIRPGYRCLSVTMKAPQARDNKRPSRIPGVFKRSVASG